MLKQFSVWKSQVLLIYLVSSMSMWGIALSLAAPTVTQLRQQGLINRQAERYPEAIADLKQAVELAPADPAGHVLLGWTYHKAGQEERAAQSLQNAVQQDWTHTPAFNALGIVYLVSGDLPATIATHTWAALLKPDNEVAYYNLGLAFQRSGDHEWAAITSQLAADLEPSNPHPLVGLAIADWARGDRQLAQRVYQQALAIDSRYADPEFLNYLDEAGFSPQQIQTAQQVLATVRP
jgi:Flp pilus assembly protein TadD